MNPFQVSAALSLLCLGSVPAQQQAGQTLLFAPIDHETTLSGTGGLVLRHIEDRCLAIVTPDAENPFSAEKWAPPLAWNTLVGDEDGDGYPRHTDLFGKIDAVMVRPWAYDQQTRQFSPRAGAVTLPEVYISPQVDLGTFCIVDPANPGLRKGDVGAIVRIGPHNGQVRHFIRAEDIIKVFGMHDGQGNALAPADINVDAVAADAERNIYLSFEEDHHLRLWRDSIGGYQDVYLEDGGVAVIFGWMWLPNEDGDVGWVPFNRGIVALSEGRVDGMVANAAVADHTGACPTTIGDLDALAVADAGRFRTKWDGVVYQLPNLRFAGETLTGGIVLSTGDGGRRARVNGRYLAELCGGYTSGEQMGLAPPDPVTGIDASINALELLDEEPARFVLGSSTADVVGPATIAVDIASNLGAMQVVLLAQWGAGAPPAGSGRCVSRSMSILPFYPDSTAFPEFYLDPGLPPPVVVGVVPLAADGWHGELGVSPGLPVGIPLHVLFQAYAFVDGRVELSTPGTCIVR